MSETKNTNPAGNPTVRVRKATGIKPPSRKPTPRKQTPPDFLTDLAKLTERAKRSKPE
jgi:hypothetical protein